MNELRDSHVRLGAGLATTSAILAAGHWFPWWQPLGRLGAYAYGCVAILLGQGIFMRFNRQWKKLSLFVAVAGSVVGIAYWYDEMAGERARRLAGHDGV